MTPYKMWLHNRPFSHAGLASFRTEKPVAFEIESNKMKCSLRLWLNDNGMFSETLICFYISEAKH